ncbi:hypothetical protein K474DRAFT_1676556 [Panus rudis PR-1116 ss-1]|nr:hypothetical protein K474DRAFT_1676556 [Panus rudis PR-1116 ss-1]
MNVVSGSRSAPSTPYGAEDVTTCRDVGSAPYVALCEMYAPSSSLNEIISLLDVTRKDNIFCLSALKVRFVWQRKLTMVTLLYAVTRYATLVSIAVQAVYGVLMLKSPSACKAFVDVRFVWDGFAVFAVPAFQSVRMWAICGRSWLLPLATFALCMVSPIISVYTHAIPITWSIIPTGPSAGCVGKSSIAVPRYTDDVNSQPGFPNIQSFLHFWILFIVNLASIILAAIPNGVAGEVHEAASGLNYVVEALSSMVIARFILDLRAVYIVDDESTLTGNIPHISIVRFSGNAGAPLQDCLSWDINAGDRSLFEDSEHPVFSENPLGAGLLPEPESYEMQPVQDDT